MARPSKYEPSYCDVVVELGKAGKSLAQMCANFDISRQTIDNWAESHPEFLEALSRAKMHAQSWWEEQGVSGMTADKFNAQVWKKSMEARFREDYTERQEIDHSGKIETADIDNRQLSRAILAVLGEAALEDSPKE
jgi:hypothetical protein